MKFINTHIDGLIIIEPDIYPDNRGCFYEAYNSKEFVRNNLSYFFVQDNEAESKFGVIRGLHFQIGNKAQAKLVRVVSGAVLDVVVDLRKDSRTYREVYSIQLSHENKKQLLIPRGFAHGYSVLSQQCTFSYKCDNFYSKNFESGINPLDPGLAIDWMIPTEEQIISPKDLILPNLNTAILDLR